MKTFTVNELRENRAKAWENAKNFLESHRNEKGMLAPEDVAAFEKMEAEIMGMGEGSNAPSAVLLWMRNCPARWGLPSPISPAQSAI